MKTIHNNVTFIGPDIDAEVFCNCGEHFFIYGIDVAYRCFGCGKLYMGQAQVVEITEDELDPSGFTLSGQSPANLLDLGKDDEQE